MCVHVCVCMCVCESGAATCIYYLSSLYVHVHCMSPLLPWLLPCYPCLPVQTSPPSPPLSLIFHVYSQLLDWATHRGADEDRLITFFHLADWLVLPSPPLPPSLPSPPTPSPPSLISVVTLSATCSHSVQIESHSRQFSFFHY